VTPVRLLLADDHALVVEGLRRLLEPRHSVVGVAHDGSGVLALVERQPADCLLLDLSMPGGNGIDLIAPIRACRPGLRIIIVTMFVERALIEAALLAGADGFVPKDAGIAELEAAIVEVMAGRRYVTRSALRRGAPALADQGLGLSQLTPRQREIVRLVGEGRTTAQIAELTGLSERTVTFHRSSVRKALGIPDERAFVRYAMMARLTGSEAPASGEDQ
jgi:DNA-binding NarL/FixJ family response regulator